MSISTETREATSSEPVWTIPRRQSDETFGEPAWEIARLFPAQGHWTEADYFALDTNRLVEFSNGRIEVLAMATFSHQLILLAFYEALKAFVSARKLGTVAVAALPVRLWPAKYREPDALFMLAEHAARIGEQAWDVADLVMEVVSEDRHHDLVTKRDEYARAGIPEYWIIDPRESRILVLTLAGETYAVHGEFAPGEVATSRLLPGFSVAVSAVLAPSA